jgi:hypothetical protein
MRKPLLLALLGGVIASSLVVGTANAGTDDPLGGYVGIGFTRPNVDDIYGIDDLNINKRSWKAMAGLSQGNFAFEGDYYDLGSKTTVDSHVQARAVAGYGVFFLPIWKFSLLGKVGMARWQKSGDENNLFSFDNHGLELAWGGGAQFTLSHFTARLEYERFNIADSQGAVVYGLSLLFKL